VPHCSAQELQQMGMAGLEDEARLCTRNMMFAAVQSCSVDASGAWASGSGVENHIWLLLCVRGR
jgi:hypothetical protein